ncbi:Oxoglutarate/iron-dependent dioxygenase [Penicillium antarcticum]|uniref:Oxoglutarate/iron-dependent dioxygenase n=1 Tax=Penicillium antarcticum TaxID=416450 RepID=UPI0023A5612E|nr:Oxoglutarate/iron-dependent dioxygenase [Penicillium antarcticum]KAJ5301577.1 Oxoglutarate/iron-dependent dioxygenase [Penicillium antarcticum]
MAKRTLDAFFKPTNPPSNPASTPKRPKTQENQAILKTTPAPQPTASEDQIPPSTHPSYPIPIANLPTHIKVGLEHATPARSPHEQKNQPELDLLHYRPYIPKETANELFKFLRRELPFYRVQYQARRGDVETQINTPRFTTVFGVDETGLFVEDTKNADSNTNPEPHPDSDTNASNNLNLTLQETNTSHAPPNHKYKQTPRPIPPCLDILRQQIEKANHMKESESYNFCLVNYYASGEDSIAFHSDDERFLGVEPNIASLSLGGERDFVMKHKPYAPVQKANGNTGGSRTFIRPQEQIKMSLNSGDMVVMRGATQANWLHSIPKRKGKAGEMTRGRINITFRRAVVPAGTNNYYHYNVGEGAMYRWDEVSRSMVAQGKTNDA